MLVDEALHSPSRRGRGKKGRTYITSLADAIPRGTCKRCGLIGDHSAGPDQCISALRDLLAYKSMR
jgi:hypothetical protein